MIYDEVQYTKNDWRNRNRIKTPNGLQWLTVPVKTAGLFGQQIKDVEIAGEEWAHLHWKAIEQNYSRSPHFHDVAEFLWPIYRESANLRLAQLNRRLIQAICGFLDIGASITDSTKYRAEGGKTEKLVEICVRAAAQVYVSGPAAKGYLDTKLF